MSPLPTRLEQDDKLYRSISEVSELVGVRPHVLRYWETQFPSLRPRKNRAGNRMYRPDEVRLLMRIKELLYDRRFTIAGARSKLNEERREAAPEAQQSARDAQRRMVLHQVRGELQRIHEKLTARPAGRG